MSDTLGYSVIGNPEDRIDRHDGLLLRNDHDSAVVIGYRYPPEQRFNTEFPYAVYVQHDDGALVRDNGVYATLSGACAGGRALVREREEAAAQAEEEALDTLHDIAQREDDDTGETVDVVIAVGDDYAPRLDALAADVADTLWFEEGTINARVVGESAWKGERETAIWFAATLPTTHVPALRTALRVIARRHRQEAIALTVGACELLG